MNKWICRIVSVGGYLLLSGGVYAASCLYALDPGQEGTSCDPGQVSNATCTSYTVLTPGNEVCAGPGQYSCSSTGTAVGSIESFYGGHCSSDTYSCYGGTSTGVNGAAYNTVATGSSCNG